MTREMEEEQRVSMARILRMRIFTYIIMVLDGLAWPIEVCLINTMVFKKIKRSTCVWLAEVFITDQYCLCFTFS